MTTSLSQTRAARNAAVILFAFCAIAVLAAQLPPLVPPYQPQAQAPMWWALALSSGGLAILLTVRPTTRRETLLMWGWLIVALAALQGFLIGDLIAMFGSLLVVPALAMLAGQLRPKPRKALVAAHAVAAASWLGVGVTFVAMAVVAMSINDIHATHAIYELMVLFDVTLLPWANFATVLTGLALSITTKWGLITYYWVAAKILIAVSILVVAFGFLHASLVNVASQAASLAATGGSAAQLSGGVDVVLSGFGYAAISLVAAVLLSLYKPGGRIRRDRDAPQRVEAVLGSR